MLQLQPLLTFLRQLEKNNHKDWFDAHRSEYETARAINLELASMLIQAVGKTDPAIALLQPKDCVFRINRDVRFSKNKAPYKNNLSVYLAPGGKKASSAGYYLHLQPNASFVAGGFYQPPAPLLSKIRQEIDYNWDTWQSITQKKSFRNRFPEGLDRADALKNPPRGYEADNPAIAILQLKSFIVQTPRTDQEVLAPGFVKEVVSTFAAMQPMLAFLNESVAD